MAAALSLSSSCATVAHWRNQTIPITSEPSGARVFIGDRQIGVTPMRMVAARRDSHLVLRVELDGYQSQDVALHRSLSAWIAADVALGPLQFVNQGLSSSREMAKAAVIAPTVFTGIDLLSGAAFKLPAAVHVTLSVK
jgi:hypothetical protein